MDNGWLDRRGRLYACDFMSHAKYATELAKDLDIKEGLEVKGWIKVHDCGVWFFSASHYMGHVHMKPTALQLRWLRSNNYDMLLARE